MAEGWILVVVGLSVCFGLLLGTTWTIMALQPKHRREAEERRRLNDEWIATRTAHRQRRGTLVGNPADDDFYSPLGDDGPSDSSTSLSPAWRTGDTSVGAPAPSWRSVRDSRKGAQSSSEPVQSSAASEQERSKNSLVQIALPITIYLSDDAAHEQVEAAVEGLVAAVGGQIEHRDDPVFGSWFRRMRAKTGEVVNSPIAREAAVLAAHAAESHLVHAKDATVTATMLQNLGPVLAALQPTKDAVIRAGALLIVKVDWIVAVHQLTAAQQLQLDHQPQLAQSPHEILSALQRRTGSPTSSGEVEVVDDNHGSLTAPHCFNGNPNSPRITSDNSKGSAALNANHQAFPEASTEA